MITMNKKITLLSISILLISTMEPLNSAIPFFNKTKESVVDKEEKKADKNKTSKEKKDTQKKTESLKAENDVVNSYIADEISFELKKLKAELKHAKNEIRELKAKSEVWTNPLSIYNKEIILNNGTTVFLRQRKANN